MNLAAIWKLPVIFACENNGYTEWTPTEKLTAGSISDRGAPFGIPGVKVDGNDVVAVRAAAEVAVARGRRGEGPTLIELATYRWHGHNEGEEAFAGDYRPQEEQDKWRGEEPILRFRHYLTATTDVDDAELDAIDAEETQSVEDAVTFAENSPFPDAEEAVQHLFADAPTTVPTSTEGDPS
jgi:pyruvate dehydrogenase E1 component alpha subunit